MRTDPDSGLVTLEWLLIFAAIAGLAASSVLTVQRVLDDTSEVPADPAVRVIDADIAAAFIASEAQSAFDADPLTYTSIDAGFSSRCAPGIEDAFDDVVHSTHWRPPGDNGTPDDPDDDVPAQCVVNLEPDLGS